MSAKGTSESPAQGKKIGTSPALEGDFNRDGKPDIAVTSDISNTVSVLLGNGSGGFNPPTSVAVGQLPGNLISADLNGDNILDLVTANALVSASNVSVLLGNGTGGFGSATNFAAGNAPRSLATGDFNGDGKPDLLVGNSPAKVSVLISDGAGSFAVPVNVSVGNNPLSIGVGDFNNDGKLDFVTANGADNNVSILLGKGQEVSPRARPARISAC